MTKTKRVVDPKYEVAFQDVCSLVNKHAANITAEELLAVCANLVGQVIALQDRRTMTPDQAMQIVKSNIEVGNAHARLHLAEAQGHG